MAHLETAPHADPMVTETTRMTRAAGVLASASLFSRILGYARDMAIAWVFGAGLYSDAFIAAFRVPNLLRRLFGEGTLSLAFIPIFSQTLSHRGRSEALALATTAIRYLGGAMAVLLVLGFVGAPVLVRLVAPGFAVDPQKFTLTLHLTRIMLPYLLVAGFLGIAMGVLNALGIFAPPALAPAGLNLTMLAAIGLGVLLAPGMDRLVSWLALGVVAGGALQLGLQIPFLWRCGMRPGLGSWKPVPGLASIGRMLPPAVFGASIFQINILVGTLLGSLLADGSVSYLFFADRLVQFPLGIFALSAAMASLPSFARQAGIGDLHGLQRTLDYGLRHVLFIMLPAVAGLMVLRRPIVAVLFEHGAFGPEAARLTAQALLCYAPGVWAVAAVRMIAPVFFALSDTRSPVAAALAALVANAILGVALMQPLGHAGIALGTSLASIVNLVLLLKALERKLGRLVLVRSTPAYLRMVGCAAAMGGGVHLLAGWAIPAAGVPSVFGLAGCIAAGVVIYGALALVSGSREMRELLMMLFRRRV